MKVLFTTTVAALVTLHVFSQGMALKQAHRHLADLSYVEAIELLEYQSRQNEKKHVEDLDVWKLLATSYQKIAEYGKAATYYEKMFASSSFAPDTADWKNYGLLLRRTGDLVKSDFYLKRYNELTAGISAPIPTGPLYIEYRYFGLETALLNINTDGADFSPVVQDNRLYFVSGRNTGSPIDHTHSWNMENFLQIFSGNIAEPAKINNVTLENSLNTKFHDGPIVFSGDGKTAYITRNRFIKKAIPGADGIVRLDIYILTKDEKGKWSKPEEFPYNSLEYSCAHPAVTADGNTIYFVSDMKGGLGGMDLYKSVRTENGWSRPENLGNTINTPANEMFPTLDDDGKLYFSSNGWPGYGGLDVFTVDTKNNRAMNLGSAVNSMFDDFGWTVLPGSKGTEGYFCSNRAGGKGGDDIYRWKENNNIWMISGTVTDKLTGKPITGAVVTIDHGNGRIIPIYTNENGKYYTPLPDVSTLTISADATDHISHTDYDIKPGDFSQEKQHNIELDRTPAAIIMVKARDKNTQRPLAEVSVNVTPDDNLLQGTSLVTGESGEASSVLYRDMEKSFPDQYIVKFEKSGYTSMYIPVEPEQLKGDTVWLEAELTYLDIPLAYSKTEMLEGKEKIPNPARPGIPLFESIYFGFDGASITAKSAEILDRLIAIMNSNPQMIIELNSHTDSRGNAEYNQKLSLSRAKQTREYLIKKGIAADRIKAQGFGESKLTNECGDGVPCPEDKHQMNRRTEIVAVRL